jgi:type IV pilus assembly protein PilQ
MVTGNTKNLLVVFFCSIGCICSTSALGAEGASEAAAGAPIAPDSPAALFDVSAEDENLPQGQQVEVGSFGQIDLHVKDLNLTKVLQLLSIQSQRNIIASRNVAGTISADLYGVDFYEALDAILHTNGFGYREKGQFIYVYTTEEIAQLEEENRTLVYEIIRLNYINAADASAFASPLLSGAGSIALSGEAEDGFQPTLSDGGANLSAHQDTLVIRDYAENIEEIVAVVAKLDTRPRQVLVEATILQARLTEANAFGVDFAVFADLNVTDFTTPLGAVDELITGGFNSGSVGTTSPGNVASGKSSVKLGFVGSDAAVFVRALDSVTDTTVLAKPQVLVLNRQKVDLLVGERLGYLSTTATETSNTQTVEFLDVGTQLTLRPFISDDDFVRMEIRPSVSDGSTSLVGGFVIPDTTTQEIVTNVIISSGQTVVLGGLFKEDTTIGRTNVPGLGGLPLVGPAFKGQDDTVSRSEVIFMIKPTIQKDENLTKMADSVNSDIEATRIGMRKGLLPWSRSKLTSKYVTDAMQHMKDGNNDKALWSLDKALYLDATLADALHLKEEITGEKTYYYERSILQGAVDSAIDAEMSSQGIEPAEADAQESEAATDETFDEDSSAASDQATYEAEVQAPTASESDSHESAKAEPAAEFESAAEAEFEELEDVSPARHWLLLKRSGEQSTETESASTWDQTPDEPAVEAPWRVELTGNDSTSVEVYDPKEFFVEENSGGDTQADDDSEGSVSSVDTEEAP